MKRTITSLLLAVAVVTPTMGQPVGEWRAGVDGADIFAHGETQGAWISLGCNKVNRKSWLTVNVNYPYLSRRLLRIRNETVAIYIDGKKHSMRSEVRIGRRSRDQRGDFVLYYPAITFRTHDPIVEALHTAKSSIRVEATFFEQGYNLEIPTLNVSPSVAYWRDSCRVYGIR